MKCHNLFMFVGCLLSQISYKLKRVYHELDQFECVGVRKVDDDTYKFYLEINKEVLDSPGLPEMTNKLMNTPVMSLTHKDKVYEVDPFKYVKMYSSDGEYNLGYFSEMKYVDKNIVCLYKDGDRCECDSNQRITTKVIYCKGQGETQIEKFFSGESSEYVLKISGEFLCNRRQTATVYYVKINKDGIVEEEEEEVPVEPEEEVKKDKELDWMKFGPEILNTLKNVNKAKEAIKKNFMQREADEIDSEREAL